jgi:hypothetical protein
MEPLSEICSPITPNKFYHISNILFSNLKNGIYYLQAKASSQKYPVYCQMTGIPGCGGGGWTLVMKTDGHEVMRLFSFHS